MTSPTPSPSPTRLATELSLLTSMYPSQITHTPHTSDLKYTQGSATLHLRLPATYPDSALPDLIGATDTRKNDIRDAVKRQFQHATQGLEPGDEALDVLIAAFQDVVQREDGHEEGEAREAPLSRTPTEPASKTVIIWLHHLLNTNKRKLALAAPSPIRGLAKPGYPGVILYTGPAAAVSAHVSLLKQQNWQAFQVRYEEAGEWEVACAGVKEVESMSEAVRVVGGGEGRKDEFLRAVGIK